jgi:DNA-binding transcriptional LysR family regulator
MDNHYSKIGLPRLSLRQMHYALAAADSGNVTGAARRLNVSQPAVSVAIATLERHYGTPLFARQPGLGMQLTGFGRQVFTEIRELLKHANSVANLSLPNGPLRGEFTLGIYEALAPYYLPAILSGFQKSLPEVRVNFFEAPLDVLLAKLHDGSADLCITYDVGLDDGFSTITLYELQPFVLASPGHPLAGKRSVRLRQLGGLPLVLLDQEASANYVLGLLHAHGVKPSTILRAGSFELQRSLVANGHGIALSHTRPLVETTYDGKALRFIRIADAISPQRVLLAASKRHRTGPVTEASRKLIAGLFANLPRASPKNRILIIRKKHA